MMKMSKKIEGENFQKEPTLTIFSHDNEDAKKHVAIFVTRYGLVSSEIKISFDRTAVSALDIIDALSDKRVRNMMEDARYCGNALPIELSDVEKEMIYDHKHDEECGLA